MMRRPPPHRGAGVLGPQQDGHLLGSLGCTYGRHLSQFIKSRARFLVNKFPRAYPTMPQALPLPHLPLCFSYSPASPVWVSYDFRCCRNHPALPPLPPVPANNTTTRLYVQPAAAMLQRLRTSLIWPKTVALSAYRPPPCVPQACHAVRCA
jgi:hypothetical protein